MVSGSRAGDVFGLPVNLSHVLTKSAEDGSLLATAVAPARLPDTMCAHPREVIVRGLDAPLEAFELRAEQ
jgi:class 3 adenylate cyclase